MDLFQKLFQKFVVKFILEDPKTCDHEWQVYGVALNQGCLELTCKKCSLVGSVDDPTKEEWSKAYEGGVGENLYDWNENERVSVGDYQLL